MLFDITAWDTDKYMVPKQTNGYECGVFMCLFIRFILNKNFNFNFNQENVTQFRSQLFEEITECKLQEFKF